MLASEHEQFGTLEITGHAFVLDVMTPSKLVTSVTCLSSSKREHKVWFL